MRRTGLDILASSNTERRIVRFFQSRRPFLVRFTFSIGIVSFPCLLLVFVTAMPWAYTYLFLGKLIGANFSLRLIVLLLVVGAISVVSVVIPMKLTKNRRWKMLILSFAVSLLSVFLLTSLFSVVLIPQVAQARNKVDAFVAENRSLDFQDYVANVTIFLDNNVRAAWDKPEASLAVNRLVCYTFLDPCILKVYKVSEADVIVHQGWGSCGEAAILIEELLHGAEYPSRLARFKGIDHEWAEAQYNGIWVIVDPWYIGNLVEEQNLKNAKPAFQQASGVEVQYRNGTWIDASHEHGY